MTSKEIPVQNQRDTNRWLVMFYDTVIYVLCWTVMLTIHPQVRQAQIKSEMTLYIICGYLLFIGFRLLFKAYKMILRYGSVVTFARLVAADVPATLLFLTLNIVTERVFHGADVPVMPLVSVAAMFALGSLVVRIVYCYLYRYASGNTKLGKAFRFLLERFALVSFDSSVSGGTLRVRLEPSHRASAPINELQWVVDKFAIRGEVVGIEQINKGYINRTYVVQTRTENGHIHKYTLQRINTNVFRDVDALMDNYKLITDTLYGRLRLAGAEKEGAVQTVRSTKDGRSYLRDDSGCWRMIKYFDNVYSLDIPNSPETFYHAGRAFGNFLRELTDVDVSAVHEVIPNFHNTKSRYEDLERSIAQDPKNRVKDVTAEIEFVRARKDKFGIITDALAAGEIPLRICHNDCNLNNILFDNETNLPVAIIDMDTVMPSSPLYDYGDSMRIGTNTARDDEKDLSKVSCDLVMYEHYARGYLEACGSILTRRELELLPYASLIITCEDGIRFLKDHIDGDTYYTICYPGQNLDRARTQLKLVEDMETKLPQIRQILRRIYAEKGLDATV